jgi:hypothetical protein
MIDPHVAPVAFSTNPNGEVVVEVHQIVRNLQGDVLTDQMVGHIFRIENGLVMRFDIRGRKAKALNDALHKGVGHCALEGEFQFLPAPAGLGRQLLMEGLTQRFDKFAESHGYVLFPESAVPR